MTQSVPNRRLAAILIADAVGFSTRMAEDEVSALRAINACLEALETVAGLNGGRIVKTLGDGLLAEFASVVNAVSAAAAMQTRLAERARDLPEAANFDFRIGVHVGDVVASGDDLLGEGVNVAARLEAAADPRGVLISASTYEHVAGKLELQFEDRGLLKLKGIPQPVGVFALPGLAAPPAPDAPTLPNKPSIAVLPFINMSSDPEQGFFADGLTEDIITALASVHTLFVVSRNSSFTYKGAAVDVRDVSRDLGVAYVLEGSVRRAGQRLRISGQLIDARSGAHLWADRLDGNLDDVFELQDQVTKAVVAAIAPEIHIAEQARAVSKRPENLTAYDHLLRALSSLGRAQTRQAITHVDAAIQAAPNYPRALGLRAWLHTLQNGWLGEDRFENHARAGLSCAEKALEQGGDDDETAAYAHYAQAYFSDLEADRALTFFRGVTHRRPSFLWALTSLGILEGLQGDAEAGIDYAARAIRLCPRDPLAFRAHLAMCCSIFYSNRPGVEYLPHGRAALAQNPTIFSTYVQFVTCLHEAGEERACAVAKRELFARWPDASVSRYRSLFLQNRNYNRHADRIDERIRATGIPE
ncbi:invasion protein regulator [Ruegeria sp. THAF57]|uniref:adenylate/guanylate cyclase domain-containing protein n=1 Tax=Ruegeria sp. THAF57 TaxID=2744555 RepID=UPI0015DE5268|nr:adenylate/guanylate cyclase domain-containing protein [Ruegeria sp. THAF57]CAD0184897.1 invasion protein regulator [Ruegeria sp. THAF57]